VLQCGWLPRLGVLKCVAAGMARLHAKNVTHWNLRSDNIFVWEGSYGEVRAVVGPPAPSDRCAGLRHPELVCLQHTEHSCRAVAVGDMHRAGCSCALCSAPTANRLMWLYCCSAPWRLLSAFPTRHAAWRQRCYAACHQQ
jgi:hypothetical protein